MYGIFLRGLEDPGFLSAICSRGGGQVCIHVQSMWLTRGVRGHALLGNFDLDLLLDAIWWNLGLFSYKHNLPFIVSLA